MRRFWIILRTELKAWSRDPITVLSGFIPPFFLLLAFSLLFSERPTFHIAYINQDTGRYGGILEQTIHETLSPFQYPYYDIMPLSAGEAWQALEEHRIDGVWVIPQDFSQRLETGENPQIEMHFSNTIDDLAKNHRIYQTEVFWRFYEKIGMPGKPLTMREEYPLPEMVNWLPIISVGIVLISFVLGGMMNIFMLTYKEQVSQVTLEFGLAPRSLGWVLAPKLLLALFMSLATGTGFLGILYLWYGIWPSAHLWAVWLLAGLVSIFWTAAVLMVGLRSRNFMGSAIGIILSAITVFFIGGGLSVIRNNTANVPWFSWLFPNTYAVDPLRDLILFHTWPVDWQPRLLILAAFAAASLTLSLFFTVRELRSRR